MTEFLSTADDLLFCVFNSYLICGLATKFLRLNPNRRRARMVFSSIWWICKYPALIYVCFNPAVQASLHGPLSGWGWLLAVMNGLVWWLYRNSGDDDDWKKMMDKLNAVISRIGSKLVVVPQSA